VSLSVYSSCREQTFFPTNGLPGGLSELLDQKAFVHVRGLMSFVEAAAELGECLLILAGEQAGFCVMGGLPVFSAITGLRGLFFPDRRFER
jgi:hypothetical protein